MKVIHAMTGTLSILLLPFLLLPLPLLVLLLSQDTFKQLSVLAVELYDEGLVPFQRKVNVIDLKGW